MDNSDHILKDDNSEQKYEAPKTAYLVIGSVLALIGLVGNFVSCVLIGCRRQLRSPTFVSFACLAFVDFFAIIVRYNVLWFHYMTVHVDNLTVFMGIYFAIGFVTLHCSCGHIILIASIRYLLVSRPLYGIVLSPQRILWYSCAIWIISCVLGVGYGFYQILLPQGYTIHAVEIVIGIYLLLGTIIPIVCLHVKKVRKLQRALSNTRVSSRRMSFILMLITSVHVISIAPSVIENIMFLTSSYLHGDVETVLEDLEYFIQVCLLLLSHGVNPIIFFVLSKSGKKHIKMICTRLICTKKKSTGPEDIQFIPRRHFKREIIREE